MGTKRRKIVRCRVRSFSLIPPQQPLKNVRCQVRGHFKQMIKTGGDPHHRVYELGNQAPAVFAVRKIPPESRSVHDGEDRLFAPAGSDDTLTEKRLGRSEKQDSLLELLCQMSFLGFEIRHDVFRFCYSVDDYKKYKILSQKMSEGKDVPIRYKIHKAFWTELMIESE